MDVFIGLDVSLASTAICVLGEKGKIVTEAQVASAPDSVVAFMHELPHGIAVIGLEAGPPSQWLHKGLTDAGFDTVLMETRLVAVARILGDGTRRRTRAFTHLQSHYLFRNRLGRPGKGKALVKTARRRFMVPIPKVHDLSVLTSGCWRAAWSGSTRWRQGSTQLSEPPRRASAPRHCSGPTGLTAIPVARIYRSGDTPADTTAKRKTRREGQPCARSTSGPAPNPTTPTSWNR